MTKSLRLHAHGIHLAIVLVCTIANLATPSRVVAKGESDVDSATLYTPIPAKNSVMGQTGSAQAGSIPSLSEAQLSYANATGNVRFARLTPTQATQFASNLAPAVRAMGSGNATQNMAQAFLQQYGAAFGVSDVVDQLQLARQETDAIRQTHLTFRQVYRGVKVFGAELRVHLNADGQVQTVNGLIVPDVKLNPVPTIDANIAINTAVRAVRESLPRSAARTNGSAMMAPLPDAVDLQARHTQLYVYQTGLAEDRPGMAYLAYQVEVIATIGNVNNIIAATGHTYRFFKNTFGRDSFDGTGGVMYSVNNDSQTQCPNASWNGTTTNYCDGVTSDDVVAHEWAHDCE